MENGVEIFHMVSWCSPPLSNLAPNSSFEVFGNKGILSAKESLDSNLLFKEQEFVQNDDILYTPSLHNTYTGPFKLIIEKFAIISL